MHTTGSRKGRTMSGSSSSLEPPSPSFSASRPITMAAQLPISTQLSPPPFQHRLLRMQHLQKQPHSRIHPDLFQQSRPRHPIILPLQRHGLDFKIAEQPHQHADEFHLREFPPRTAARTTGPADKGTIACGRLLQMLYGMCGWAFGGRNGWIRGDPSRWLEVD